MGGTSTHIPHGVVGCDVLASRYEAQYEYGMH